MTAIDRDNNILPDLSPYPNLAAIAETQLGVWSSHARYIAQRFGDDDREFLRRTDDVARLVRLLAGERLVQYCEDYKWMCGNFMEEDLHFRRHQRYRLQTFAEADRE